MIITFIGHGQLPISNELKEQIQNTVKENISTAPVTFFCGGYGTFDFACAHIVKDLQVKYPHIRSVFVTPYRDERRIATFKELHLYDEILYPGLENVPKRFAILVRNEYMVDHADLVIAYVEHEYGGAYKALTYAMRKKKRVINLSGKNIQ